MHIRLSPTWFLFTLLELTLASSSFSQQIPIPNAGFEKPENQLQGWTLSVLEGGQGTNTLETAHSHSGKCSLKMSKTNVVGYNMGVSDYLPVKAGQEYEVRAWISVIGRARGSIYFMVSQYKPDRDDMQLPNAFGIVRSYYTGEGWKLINVKLKVREGNTRLRIHALAAFAPVMVYWDDFELVEVTPGSVEYKPRYEKPRPESLPPLEPAKLKLAQRKPATAYVQRREGRARFVIDGKVTPPCFYVGPFHHPQDSHIGDFQKAGVRVYLVPLILGHGVYGDKGPWFGPDQYDFKEVDELLWRVLRVDPEGYIIFYMGTDPYHDWGKEHPTEVCCDQDGKKSVVVMHPKAWGREPQGNERYAPSLVSSVLRADTAKALRSLIRYVRSLEAGKAVIGYHVAGLNDGQFFQWASYDPADIHLADYSEASIKAFRDWLRRLYRDDVTVLRRAWNQPEITFATAAIPSGSRRLAAGCLVDARRDQDIADYTRFYSEGTVETIAGYARVVKEATEGKALVSTYYEDSPASVDSHLALGRLLSCKDFDFFAGPAAYGVRMAGEVGECHSTWGSVRLHNRIWLTEQDWRSWMAGSIDEAYDHSVGRALTAQDHNAMVRRECGMMLAYGHGTWWYDMDGGWFRDDDIMKGIAEARAAFSRDLGLPGTPKAEMAVFIDERSQDYLAFPFAGPYRYQGIVQQLFTLNQCGVPYHLYLQEDLAQRNLPDYKLYVFLNAHHLSAEERSILKALRRDQKTFVFVHAPGVVGAADPAAAISEITGIRTRLLPKEQQLIASPAGLSHPLLQNLGGALSLASLSGTAFAVEDLRAITLGSYPDGSVAVACRDFGNWRSVFFGAVGLSDQFLNNLAKWSGAWVASEPGDAVYASQYFATIHALYSGEKTLRFLSSSMVTDLTTGQILSTNAKTLKLTMEQGETRWFELKPLSEP